MLEFIRGRESAAFRRALKSAVSGGAGQGEILKRTLTTPGGPIEGATIIWRADLGLWAYFSPKAYNGRRWMCWFGLHAGDLPPTLQPAIEINIEVDPKNRNVRGRALINRDDGAFYLAHRGGLGGGRGGQMSLPDFARHIRGFGLDTVERSPGDDEEMFVVSNLATESAPTDIRRYVQECARLRAFARRRAEPTAETTGFNPEADQDGFQARSAAEIRAIRRLHGRVVNALQKQLPKGARNTSRSRLRPDLYLPGPGGEMNILFEVKAISDSQSWFTALGQLVVYGAEQTSLPARVLVCPAKLKDIAFANALNILDVKIVTFVERGGTVVFFGLDTVLASL